MTGVTGRLGAAASIAAFVGRRREIADVRAQMEISRLVTLTGPGGIGKTRLAMEAATRMRKAFPDGVWPVELASVEDGREVASTAVLSLDVADQSSRAAVERLSSHVRNRKLLLILDNCEHLLADTAELVAVLLDTAPELRVLATSREPLGIAGERVYLVPPLSVPPVDQLHDVATVDHSDAVRLLVDRARNVVPDFAVDENNRSAVRQLCEWLDGMPLAIELAATRLRTLSVRQMVERLDDHFQLLTGGSRVALPRQQTLRALMEWSYELCTHDEQRLWARLSVFPGGFDLDAAETVCGCAGLPTDSVVDLLDRLVAKSIVRVDRTGERVRYAQLMTVREYGAERLAEFGGHRELKRRHRDHYSKAARRMVADWCGAGQHVALADMRQDHPNLLSALEWSVNTPGEQSTGAVLAADLRYHWIAGGFLSDGRSWLERVLTTLDDQATAERGAALWVCAWVALIQGDRRRAAVLLREADSVADELGDVRLRAHVAHWWALLHLFSGDLEISISKYREAVAVHAEVGDTAALLTAQFQLGLAEANDAKLHDALATCERALDTSEKQGERWTRAYSQWVTGLTWWRLGELTRAKNAARAALEIQRDFTDGICTALTLELLSGIETMHEQCEAACSLFGAAQTVWMNLGTTVEAFGPHLADESQRLSSALRAKLGDTRVDEVIAGLAHISKADAIELALGDHAPNAKPPAMDNPLTNRELDVARLVADGNSNREVAAALVLSTRTVDGHVERILGKLGFTSRTQIASWISAREDESNSASRA